MSGHIAGYRDGSVAERLNLPTIRSLPVVVPPLPEQRAIAHILGTLDDKIEVNRRMSATLEAMARALFKSWFVDFEPVRAKAEGRDVSSGLSGTAGDPGGLPPHLAALFPARLVETEQGELPEGWRLSTIGEEVRVVGGSTPSTASPEYWDGDINWTTPKDLSTLCAPVLLQTSRKVTESGLATINSGLLPAGALLLSSRAPIGYLAIAEIPVAINQGFIAMVCESQLSNIFTWLWTSANMKAILAKANGSTFQEISKASFRPLPVFVPTAHVSEAFDALANPLFSRIVQCERESVTLAAVRDTLLPKLISGELRARDADKMLERGAL
jgi:type I restriction enzyme S subunit